MQASPVMDMTFVSHEMISLVGTGSIGSHEWPKRAVAFAMTFGGLGAPATLRFHQRPTTRALNHDADECRLILIVDRDACRRLLGGPLQLEGDTFHLTPALRSIALAIRDCDLAEAARTPYRLAKSLELLCDLLRAHANSALVPLGDDGSVSQADGQRLLAARRMIEDQWSEKLTLDMIARACGLNRAKLTRGFRSMFKCSVADAMADHRLSAAGQMLLATDLPVSSIGYRCGYLNNASFSRAFTRRFGIAPTLYRTHRIAA